MVRRYQKRYRSNLYKKSTRSKKPKLLSVPEQIHQEITAVKSELRELRKKTFSAPETVSNKVQSLNVSKKQEEAWIEKNKNLYLKKKARIEEINEELKRKNFISRTLFSEELNKENVHADYIHPVGKGGLSTKTNMVLVCSTCNLAKRNHTLRSFCSRCGFDFETVVARLMSLGKDV